jgi:hypothetical protein
MNRVAWLASEVRLNRLLTLLRNLKLIERIVTVVDVEVVTQATNPMASHLEKREEKRGVGPYRCILLARQTQVFIVKGLP